HACTDAHLHLLERAKVLGLDWVELVCGDNISFTPRLTRERARQLGLRLVLSPGGLWPMECDLSLPDPTSQQRALDWHRRAINLAAEIGAVAYTGALYGHPGRVERRRPTQAEYAQVAAHLHALADDAAEQGVRLVIEPMSHFRTHLVNRPEQAMQLISLAAHPNLGVLLDTYHLVTEIRDYAAAIRVASPCLWGIHACENDRGVPGGGLIPWDQVGAALRAIGFGGYVGLESYYSGPGGLAEARGLFNDPCPDGDAFVRAGLAFLRRVFGPHSSPPC
ncbi:MAG: sugar phosphate isomerase/epimerase family protein, partial [Armatimonadota bacterium]|nr:sugar phosphate isomerase/epimerase family protein [Armatimonadota bacterium]